MSASLSVCSSAAGWLAGGLARLVHVSIDAKLGWDHEGRSRRRGCDGGCCRRQGRFRCISVSVRDTAAARTAYSTASPSAAPKACFSSTFFSMFFLTRGRKNISCYDLQHSISSVTRRRTLYKTSAKSYRRLQQRRQKPRLVRRIREGS